MFEGNKVNPADIDAVIVNGQYVLLPDGRTTICLLTLDNGYTVRGEASCVDIANYDKATGEKYSLEDAKRKIWPLLGFRLADRLHSGNRFIGKVKELGAGYRHEDS